MRVLGRKAGELVSSRTVFLSFLYVRSLLYWRVLQIWLIRRDVFFFSFLFVDQFVGWFVVMDGRR